MRSSMDPRSHIPASAKGLAARRMSFSSLPMTLLDAPAASRASM